MCCTLNCLTTGTKFDRINRAQTSRYPTTVFFSNLLGDNFLSTCRLPPWIEWRFCPPSLIIPYVDLQSVVHVLALQEVPWWNKDRVQHENLATSEDTILLSWCVRGGRSAFAFHLILSWNVYDEIPERNYLRVAVKTRLPVEDTFGDWYWRRPLYNNSFGQTARTINYHRGWLNPSSLMFLFINPHPITLPQNDNIIKAHGL